MASESNVAELAKKLVGSCEWLHSINELHYFSYNSCNSLTIYSYKFWPQKNSLLVSTKENNIKQVSFVERTCKVMDKVTQRVEYTIGGEQASVAVQPSSDVESDQMVTYLEPVFRIHKMPKISSNKEPNLMYLILT